jgi:hypothetical protein
VLFLISLSYVLVGIGEALLGLFKRKNAVA